MKAPAGTGTKRPRPEFVPRPVAAVEQAPPASNAPTAGEPARNGTVVFPDSFYDKLQQMATKTRERRVEQMRSEKARELRERTARVLGVNVDTTPFDPETVFPTTRLTVPADKNLVNVARGIFTTQTFVVTPLMVDISRNEQAAAGKSGRFFVHVTTDRIEARDWERFVVVVGGEQYLLAPLELVQPSLALERLPTAARVQNAPFITRPLPLILDQLEAVARIRLLDWLLHDLARNPRHAAQKDHVEARLNAFIMENSAREEARTKTIAAEMQTPGMRVPLALGQAYADRFEAEPVLLERTTNINGTAETETVADGAVYLFVETAPTTNVRTLYMARTLSVDGYSADFARETIERARAGSLVSIARALPDTARDHVSTFPLKWSVPELYKYDSVVPSERAFDAGTAVVLEDAWVPVHGVADDFRLLMRLWTPSEQDRQRPVNVLEDSTAEAVVVDSGIKRRSVSFY